jgi:hypothetical protein
LAPLDTAKIASGKRKSDSHQIKSV